MKILMFNSDIKQPEDRGILLKDILENGVALRDKSQTIPATIYKENAKSMLKRKKFGLLSVAGPGIMKLGNVHPSGRGMNGNVFSVNGKSPTLTTNKGEGIKISDYSIEDDDFCYRKLTPMECERLQTVDDDYTNHVSNTQRYKMLGNGFTIEAIVHILKNIKGLKKK